MIRTIDFNSIGEASSKLLAQINELKNEQITLLNDIENISASYQGKDAETIISEYKEKASNISGHIEFLEEFHRYLDWLSSSYKDNYDKAHRDVKAELDKIKEETNSFNNEFIQNIKKKAKDGDNKWLIQ